MGAANSRAEPLQPSRRLSLANLQQHDREQRQLSAAPDTRGLPPQPVAQSPDFGVTPPSKGPIIRDTFRPRDSNAGQLGPTSTALFTSNAQPRELRQRGTNRRFSAALKASMMAQSPMQRPASSTAPRASPCTHAPWNEPNLPENRPRRNSRFAKALAAAEAHRSHYQDHTWDDAARFEAFDVEQPSWDDRLSRTSFFGRGSRTSYRVSHTGWDELNDAPRVSFTGRGDPNDGGLTDRSDDSRRSFRSYTSLEDVDLEDGGWAGASSFNHADRFTRGNAAPSGRWFRP